MSLWHSPTRLALGASVILADVAVGSVKQVLIGVQLVSQQQAAKGLHDLSFALRGYLPPVEANLLNDGIDVGAYPLDDHLILLG